MKSEELTKEFSETEAYVNLFMELATDEKAAIAFAEGVMPKFDEANVTTVAAAHNA